MFIKHKYEFILMSPVKIHYHYSSLLSLPISLYFNAEKTGSHHQPSIYLIVQFSVHVQWFLLLTHSLVEWQETLPTSFKFPGWELSVEEPTTLFCKYIWRTAILLLLFNVGHRSLGKAGSACTPRSSHFFQVPMSARTSIGIDGAWEKGSQVLIIIDHRIHPNLHLIIYFVFISVHLSHAAYLVTLFYLLFLSVFSQETLFIMVSIYLMFKYLFNIVTIFKKIKARKRNVFLTKT